MNEDFFTRFRKSPRPEFATTLYERISKPMSTPYHLFPRRQLALAFMVIAVILTATLVVSPGARVLAVGLLRQIGVLILSDRPVDKPVLIAPSSSEQLALAQATATPVAPDAQQGTPLEVAIARAGFEPYLPGYVPAGFVQVDIEAAEYLDDQGVHFGKEIFITYLSNTEGYLSISTTSFDQRIQDVPMGGRAITDVTINGHPGVWIEELPFESPHTPSRAINMLLWEDNSFVLTIQSDQLPLAEVLRIAELLGQ